MPVCVWPVPLACSTCPHQRYLPEWRPSLDAALIQQSEKTAPSATLCTTHAHTHTNKGWEHCEHAIPEGITPTANTHTNTKTKCYLHLNIVVILAILYLLPPPRLPAYFVQPVALHCTEEVCVRKEHCSEWFVFPSTVPVQPWPGTAPYRWVVD